MKSKRGFLLAEETLKMILAVLVIIVLLGLLTKIYYGYQNDKELKEAEATLERLSKVLPELTEGVTKEFEIFNPIDEGVDWNTDRWILFRWPEGDAIPNQCSIRGWEDCICICKNSWASIAEPNSFGLLEEFEIKKSAEKCDEIGTCIESPQLLNEDFMMVHLKGDSPLTINLEKTSEGIKISEVN